MMIEGCHVAKRAGVHCRNQGCGHGPGQGLQTWPEGSLSWAGPSKIQKMHYSTPAYQSMSLQPCLPTSVCSLEVASRAGRDQKLVSQEEEGPRFEHRTLSLQPKVLNHCTQHCPHLEHSKFTGSCEAHCTCYEKALICPLLSLFKYMDGQLKFIRYIQRISSMNWGRKASK